MNVPEALATTIRILLMFSIVLAHRWNPGVWARPIPRERLIGTPSVPHRHPIPPWAPRRPARLLGTVRWGGHPEGGTNSVGALLALLDASKGGCGGDSAG